MAGLFQKKAPPQSTGPVNDAEPDPNDPNETSEPPEAEAGAGAPEENDAAAGQSPNDAEPDEGASPPSGGRGGLNPKAPPVPDTESDSQAATPEEQAIYDRFVSRALTAIYGQGPDRTQHMKQMQAMLAHNGDPITGLAVTAATIIKLVSDAANKAGQPVPEDILLHAGSEVFADLANLATVSKVHDFNNTPKDFEAAFYRTLDQYRLMLQASGEVDKGANQQLLAQLQEWDKTGQLHQGMQNLKEGKPIDAGMSPDQSGGQAPDTDQEPDPNDPNEGNEPGEAESGNAPPAPPTAQKKRMG